MKSDFFRTLWKGEDRASEEDGSDLEPWCPRKRHIAAVGVLVIILIILSGCTDENRAGIGIPDSASRYHCWDWTWMSSEDSGDC